MWAFHIPSCLLLSLYYCSVCVCSLCCTAGTVWPCASSTVQQALWLALPSSPSWVSWLMSKMFPFLKLQYLVCINCGSIITVHEMPCIVIPRLLFTVHEMPCIVIPSFLILLLLLLLLLPPYSHSFSSISSSSHPSAPQNKYWHFTRSMTASPISS